MSMSLPISNAPGLHSISPSRQLRDPSASGMGGMAAGMGSPSPSMNSTDILQGQKTVEINHNGSTYRLQATRLGKLILTK